MRTIAVVTSGRADYGICVPILRRLVAAPDLRLHLLVTGMHLSSEFGRTITYIESDGFSIADRIEMLVGSDSPEAVSKSMGLGAIGFAQSFTRERPDVLLVPGDRFEVHAAAVAALPFNIPVAHLHGGELTRYAIDDSLRHSLTKLSHLHFVSTETYAARVIQMGEEPWRVLISGAPGLENIPFARRIPVQEIESRLQLSLEMPPLLVTFHPVTKDVEHTDRHVNELVAALTQFDAPIVVTSPNADTGGRRIAELFHAFASGRQNVRFVSNLGTDLYFSLMTVAGAMVGNSSSGLIEAPSFRLPVVNIGDRQADRVRAANVIDTGYERSQIAVAIRRALDPMFRAGLQRLVNPYARPGGVNAIVETLATVPLDSRLLVKRFHDIDIRPGDHKMLASSKMTDE